MSPTTDADADTARPTVGHWTHDDCDIYIGRGYDGESNADLDDASRSVTAAGSATLRGRR